MPGMETNEVLTAEQAETLRAARAVLYELAKKRDQDRLAATAKVACDVLTSTLVVAKAWYDSQNAELALYGPRDPEPTAA